MPNYSSHLKYYSWEQVGKLKEVSSFEHLLNWISGEFELNLQLDEKIFKVYFPNGFFTVQRTIIYKVDFEYRIIIKSKCKRTGIHINDKIEKLVLHYINSRLNRNKL